MTRITEQPIPPLERFVRDYVEAREGEWDEIEPQVYDLLVGSEMLQVAFDPEALPEYPQAQPMSLGSPLLDRLLADAAGRWSCSRFFRVGLNLHPHGLDARLSRAVSVPPPASIHIERVRAMNFPQAIFWFKAVFVSDQKEEEILPIGIDLHHLREVRHLDSLLATHRLSETGEPILPEARHAGLTAGFRAARGKVAPTVASLANLRRRGWAGRVQMQIGRMSNYYAQLRRESDESPGRGADEATAAARLEARRQAIEREEHLRIAELRRKSAIRVSVRLSSLMIVQQPKLWIAATVTEARGPAGKFEAVWDPLTEAMEAIACPACGQPTFALVPRRSGLGCDKCGGVKAR